MHLFVSLSGVYGKSLRPIPVLTRAIARAHCNTQAAAQAKLRVKL